MPNILIAEFETYCKEQLGLSEHSLRAYAQDLRAFSDYVVLHNLAGTPSQTDVIGYQKHLRESRTASPSTIRRRFITLKSYYAWLEGEDASMRSPFNGLRLDLKIPKRLPRPVDRPTLSALFRTSKGIVEPELDKGAASDGTYTGPYGSAYDHAASQAFEIKRLEDAADAAADLGLGVNAGHDLTVEGTARLVKRIPSIDEVSIGHALFCDALTYGMAETVRRYVVSCSAGGPHNQSGRS